MTEENRELRYYKTNLKMPNNGSNKIQAIYDLKDYLYFNSSVKIIKEVSSN